MTRTRGRKLAAGLVLCGPLLLGGCFEQELAITVLPDGSGTITVRSVAAKKGLSPEHIAEFHEAEQEMVEPLRAAASGFGSVELVGVETVDDEQNLGHVATYRFEDVNDVLLRYPEQEGMSDISIFRFRFTPGTPSRLEVSAPPPDDSPELSESPEMMAMFLDQMAGWRRHYSVRLPGELVDSDVEHVVTEGEETVVTLMELDIDALLEDPEGTELLSEAGMDFQMMSRLGIAGVKAQDPDSDTVLNIRFHDAAAAALASETALSSEAAAVACDVRSQQPATLGSHEGPVTAAAISGDCDWVATGSSDGTAAVWSYAAGAEVQRLAVADNRSVMTVAFSPDGERLLTAGANTSRRDRMAVVQMWDVASGAELWRFPEAGFEAGELADGTWSNVWSQWSGRRCNQAGGTGNNPLSSRRRVAVVLSPDGGRVLVGSYDGSVRLLDAGTGVPLIEFNVPPHVALSAAFAPDGETVAVGGADGSVQLWATATGDFVRRLPPHQAAVTAVAFSLDGEQLLTGSEDHAARVLSTSDDSVLREIGELCPESGEDTEWSGLEVYMASPVTSAAFSPDGEQILIVRAGAFAELWSSGSGGGVDLFELGAGLFSEVKPVTAVVFSPDGQTLLSGSADALTAKLTSVHEGESWGDP